MRIAHGTHSPLVFIFVAVLIDMVGYGMILPLLPLFVQQQNGGGTMVGLVSALYAVAQFIVGPVLGGLSDHFGRRPVLLYGLGGMGLAYLLLGLADSLALLMVAVVIAGGAGGSVATAQAYIADRTTADERTRGLGMVGAAFGLGLMLGPAFGGLLSRFGLSVPAFVAAGLAFANLVFGLLVLPESLPPERRRRVPLPALNPVRQLAALLSIAGMRGLLLTVFLLNMAFAGLQSNFPLFSSTRFGWDATDNGLFFAFVGISAVITQGLLLGKLQPHFGEARLVRGGLLLMALNLALVSIAPYGWMLYPMVALLALGTGLCIPSLTSLISQRGAVHEQGTILSGTQAVLSLTMIGGPLIAGLAFDYLGMTAPYLLGSMLSAAALLVAIVALRHRQAGSPEALKV